MALKDQILEEKNEYVLKGQLAQEEIQKKISKFEGMEADLAIELEAATEAGYQKRLEEEGVAGTDELIYSDKDMNEEVAKRKVVEAELAALKESKEIEISDAVAKALTEQKLSLTTEFVGKLKDISVDNNAYLAELEAQIAPQPEPQPEPEPTPEVPA